MIKAIALLLVFAINSYLSTKPELTRYLNVGCNTWSRAYLEYCLKFSNKLMFLRGEFIALLSVLPLFLSIALLHSIFVLVFPTALLALWITLILVFFIVTSITAEHESIFILAHEQIFGIIFWFSIAGIYGATGYWLLTVIRTKSAEISFKISNFQNGLDIAHGIAAWLPSRITGFIYALMGNFVVGFNCWRNCIRGSNITSSKMLVDCGTAAIDPNIHETADALVKRATIAWFLIAILISSVIAGLVGS